MVYPADGLPAAATSASSPPPQDHHTNDTTLPNAQVNNDHLRQQYPLLLSSPTTTTFSTSTSSTSSVSTTFPLAPLQPSSSGSDTHTSNPSIHARRHRASMRGERPVINMEPILQVNTGSASGSGSGINHSINNNTNNSNIDQMHQQSSLTATAAAAARDATTVVDEFNRNQEGMELEPVLKMRPHAGETSWTNPDSNINTINNSNASAATAASATAINSTNNNHTSTSATKNTGYNSDGNGSPSPPPPSRWTMAIRSFKSSIGLKPKASLTRESSRVIPIQASRTTPLIQPETGKPFVSNAVTTARYTIWSFLPKQLYAQFSKIANVYFLFVASLQMVPSWSPTGQFTTLVPLVTFLSIAIAHEGYDDWRRHKQDNVENNQKANVFRLYRDATNTVLGDDRSVHHADPPEHSLSIAVPPTPIATTTSGGLLHSASNGASLGLFQKIRWKDLAVGDIIKVEQNDWVPADLIVLHSGGHEGGCFIETAALDGETNLKQRQALKVTNDAIHSPEDLGDLAGVAQTEQPNQDLYNFEGFLELERGKQVDKYALSINQILLRGTILRNTPYVYGLVVFSGEDTKIRQNGSKNVRTKAPSMQRLINRVIILIFSIVIFLSALCTVMSTLWNNSQGKKAWYVNVRKASDTASVLFGYIILFNTMIPISLYVTMELVKLLQAYFIQQDMEMYDPVTNTPAEARTSVINEELGQVSYLFSDKTGTLTENIMVFRKFCVAGHSFNHDLDPETVLTASKVPTGEAAMDISIATGHESSGGTSSETGGQAGQDLHQRRKSRNIARRLSQKLRQSSRRHHNSRNSTSDGYQNLDMRGDPELGSAGGYAESIHPTPSRGQFTDPIVPCTPTSQLLPFLQSGSRHVMAERIRFFLLSMALCHDAVPELMNENDPESLKYQAASPDENALVAGAKELGYVFLERGRGGVRVRSLGSTVAEDYEILNVIDFSSKRKRMSVIYRMPDGQICLFTKGADSIILERVRDPVTGFDFLPESAVVLDSPVPFTPISTSGVLDKQATFDRMNAQAKLGAGEAYSSFALTGREDEYDEPESAAGGVGDYGGNPKSAIAHRRAASLASNPIYYQSPLTMTADDNGLKQPFPTSPTSAGPISTGNKDDLGAYFFGQTPGMVQSEMWEYQHTMDYIQEYATTGLRTLLYGHRFLTKDEYSDWSKQYAEAQSALEGRQEKLEAVAELLEQNLDMTGATAIEDKLQDGVPETIDKLRRAGIRLWMLTGDKRETAINIGYSCRLIKDYSSTIILDVPTQAQAHKALNKALRDVNKGKSRHVVVVIDGATLGIVEQSPDLMALFVDLGIRADSVICCRVSPAQKALVVKTVRAKIHHTVTLAIGDGANDIAMIQEANVGIGITGKEGLQAARSSDYSIAQFRFLERLLFVHGRWSYVRISKFVLGTFYKCATFYLTQGFFQIFTGFSGTSLYEQWALSFYNTLFSSLPVMVVGMFEQDLKASTLLLVPELYTYGQRNGGFSIKAYLTWMAAAVFHAAATLFVPMLIFGAFERFGVEVDEGSLFTVGVTNYSAIVFVVTFKIAYLETHNWSIMTHITSALTLICWFGYNTTYSFIYPVQNPGYDVRGVFAHLISHMGFWLIVVVTFMIAIIPNVMAKMIKSQVYPSDVDLYQELEQDPDAVQRWKEWEIELGAQGAEAEGVTGAKIKRRLSIAASIVSRQSSHLGGGSHGGHGGRPASHHGRRSRSHSRSRSRGHVSRSAAGTDSATSSVLGAFNQSRRGSMEESHQPKKSFRINSESGHGLGGSSIMSGISLSSGLKGAQKAIRQNGPWSATQATFPSTFTSSSVSAGSELQSQPHQLYSAPIYHPVARSELASLAIEENEDELAHRTMPRQASSAGNTLEFSSSRNRF